MIKNTLTGSISTFLGFLVSFILSVYLSLCVSLLHSFHLPKQYVKPKAAFKAQKPHHPANEFVTALFAGRGAAKSYRWVEEQDEIEIIVKVPSNTRAKDIIFNTGPTSIDMRLLRPHSPVEKEVILLDGSRELRGKVAMDGTFWSIADNDSRDGREISVMVEKNTKVGEFEVYRDWEGVFQDDEEEVLERDYKEPEELDVREYCKSIGVDIDNIDMSKVDKSIFSTVNMTKDTLRDLQKGGYVREVTQQGNLEFLEERGEATPFPSEGGIAVHKGEHLSSDSPSVHNSAYKRKSNDTDSDSGDEKESLNTGDPIDMMTVVRLKDVLREHKLKVSGTKQELRDRLRKYIESVLKEDDVGDHDGEENRIEQN